MKAFSFKYEKNNDIYILKTQIHSVSKKRKGSSTFKDCLGSKSNYKPEHRAEKDPQSVSHPAVKWATTHIYIGNASIPALVYAFGKCNTLLLHLCSQGMFLSWLVFFFFFLLSVEISRQKIK